MNRCVLLVDKDQKRTSQIHNILLRSNDRSFTATNIQTAISDFVSRTFDVIALNMTLPNVPVLLDSLLEIQKLHNTRILLYPILSENERAHYLTLGFDVCLASDSTEECASAINALLRMTEATAEKHNPKTGLISYKDFSIDQFRHKVFMRGDLVELTSSEFNILYYLASNPGLVFSKENIYDELWGEDAPYGCDSIPRFICEIRRKLGLKANDTEYLKTIVGVGYCFAP